tara:strand:- start:276 stop:1325 length:1050 start_codon:yes stop_codon:yes gene_type:complete
MFNCFKPTRVVNEPAMVILDLDFRIVHCTTEFTRLTGHKLEDLKNKCVSRLMTYFVKITHEKLFSRLRNSNKSETFVALDKEIEIMRKMRFVNIISAHDTVIKCNLNFSYDYTGIYIKFKKVTNIHSPHIIDKTQLALMNDEPRFSVSEYPDYVSILFDVCNSTELVKQMNSTDIAKLYHDLIKLVSDKINKKYTPYARIHETCGDSIYIYIKPCESQFSMAILLAIEASRLMNRILDKYDTHVRCGITIGTLSGGVIDGRTFRMFGESINLAQRLEGLCNKNEINISDDIFENLVPADQGKFKKIIGKVPNFGTMEYYIGTVNIGLNITRRASFVCAPEFTSTKRILG